METFEKTIKEGAIAAAKGAMIGTVGIIVVNGILATFTNRN